MHRIFFYIAFIILFATVNANAQRKSSKQFDLSISYFGNTLTKPGLKVSTTPFIWGSPAVEDNSKRFRFLHQVSMGFFVSPRTNTSLFATTEPGIRLSTRGGFRFESFLGAGYMRIFNAGTTYTVTEEGIEKVPLASRGYFIGHLTLGIGKDLFLKKGKPIAWHLRPSFYVLTPYNAGINILVNLELGITYTFNAPDVKS